MRLFIALPLPPDVRRALIAAQEMLRGVSEGGRYVPYENFHVTLHFIGESTALFDAAAACDEAVRGIRPMLFRLGGFGRFSRGSTYTAYTKVLGDMDELYRLHETLTGALTERGFSLLGGHKRLTPHITLARGLTPKENDGFSSLAQGINAGFTANQLILYESKSFNGGMVYTPLHRVMI